MTRQEIERKMDELARKYVETVCENKPMKKYPYLFILTSCILFLASSVAADAATYHVRQGGGGDCSGFRNVSTGFSRGTPCWCTPALTLKEISISYLRGRP